MELKIDKLTKQFGTNVAVDQVSAVLKPGIIGLLGANGSGKTTLMRLLVDVVQADRGEVLYNGEAITTLKETYLIDLGYLPQSISMYPSFKVQEFLQYMGSLKGLSRKYTKERMDFLLQELHLDAQRHKKIKQLSGGMKQRLGIAQALLNDPAILILDEPTVGLDPKERNHFSQMLANMASNKIILLSTHIVSDIEHIADQIMIMKQGSMVDYDTPEHLIQKLSHKVFEQVVSLEEAVRIQESMILCNQKNDGKRIQVRYISEAPLDGAKEVVPTLSDVYLYHFDKEDEEG